MQPQRCMVAEVSVRARTNSTSRCQAVKRYVATPSSAFYTCSRSPAPRHPPHPLAYHPPLLPPPLASGGALSSSCSVFCASGFSTWKYGHRTPKFTGLAPCSSPATIRLFVHVTGVVVDLACHFITRGPHPWSRPLPTSHPPAPWTTPVLAQRSLVLWTARASNGFGFECRQGRLCGWL
ncbi:hypothetical protein B0H13DRAFT_1115675 [Mycena leptocephala]|nr:hypothetical protein B0H13DRAFT_1115675 [Mycena leptocephala]